MRGLAYWVGTANLRVGSEVELDLWMGDRASRPNRSTGTAGFGYACCISARMTIPDVESGRYH